MLPSAALGATSAHSYLEGSHKPPFSWNYRCTRFREAALNHVVDGLRKQDAERALLDLQRVLHSRYRQRASVLFGLYGAPGICDCVHSGRVRYGRSGKMSSYLCNMIVEPTVFGLP